MIAGAISKTLPIAPLQAPDLPCTSVGALTNNGSGSSFPHLISPDSQLAIPVKAGIQCLCFPMPTQQNHWIPVKSIRNNEPKPIQVEASAECQTFPSFCRLIAVRTTITVLNPSFTFGALPLGGCHLWKRTKHVYQSNKFHDSPDKSLR